jgi:hypothetical protein
MLQRLLAFFTKQQPQQPAAIEPDPRWQAYKAVVAEHRLAAQQEKEIGVVAAITSRVDNAMQSEQDVWGTL